MSEKELDEDLDLDLVGLEDQLVPAAFEGYVVEELLKLSCPGAVHPQVTDRPEHLVSEQVLRLPHHEPSRVELGLDGAGRRLDRVQRSLGGRGVLELADHHEV